MKAGEFVKRVRKLGRDRGIGVRFNEKLGKGSHGTLYYGSRKCTVKDRRKEIGPGLLRAMLDQLGLTREDFDSKD